MNNIVGLENVNESLSTHYLIYKITNTVNQRYYIGQHCTENPSDNYMGSGDYIIRAENKYGLSCFQKEILFDFDNFEDMNNKESELVQLSNCFPYDQMSYNLIPGGHAPIMFGESNPAYGKNPFRNKSKKWYDEYMQMMHDINAGENNPMYSKNPLANMTLSAYQSRNDKISKAQSGLKNSQAGVSPKERMDPKTYEQWKKNIGKKSLGNKASKGHKWINNGIIQKCVKPEKLQEYLDNGFKLGQIK